MCSRLQGQDRNEKGSLQMMNSRNVFQLVAVCGFVAVSLTACHPALRGGASLSIDEHGLPLIGVCHEMSVTEARITVRDKDDDLLARARLWAPGSEGG